MIEMDINNQTTSLGLMEVTIFIPFQRMDELLTFIKPHVWLCHCLTWIFYDFT